MLTLIRSSIALSVLLTANVAFADELKGDHAGGAATWLYADDAGLTVVTTAARVAQRIGAAVVSGDVVLDRLHQAAGDPGHAASLTAIDTVTAASSRPKADGTRAEADVAVRVEASSVAVTTEARASVEEGYVAGSGNVTMQVAAGEGQTLLSVGMGYGHDVASDDLDDAPRDHVEAQFAATQILTESVALSVGVGVANLWGDLSTPGALAPYKWTFLTEAVPDARLRASTFVGVIAYVAEATALHTKLSAYADDWGIAALSPEVRLAHDFGSPVTMSLAYRFYAQSSASFYEVLYLTEERLRTGDMRMGSVMEHRPSVSLDWRMGGAADVALHAGYAFSDLEHRSMHHTTLGHVAMFGVSLGR